MHLKVCKELKNVQLKPNEFLILVYNTRQTFIDFNLLTYWWIPTYLGHFWLLVTTTESSVIAQNSYKPRALRLSPDFGWMSSAGSPRASSKSKPPPEKIIRYHWWLIFDMSLCREIHLSRSHPSGISSRCSPNTCCLEHTIHSTS